MVDPLRLAFDITSVAVSTAVPGIAWALLFVLAWRHRDVAETLGLGPMVFWLLLPGGILASFALVPLVPISGDIVAISFAGALFPLGIGVRALGRLAPYRRVAVRVLAPLAIEATVLLGVVEAASTGSFRHGVSGWGIGAWAAEVVAVTGVATLVAVVVVGLSRRRTEPSDPALAGAVVLTSAVLVLTFVGSQAVPGVGITESFPYFLLPPVLVGVVAVLLAPRWLPGRETFALPLAFFAAGWGVMLGADVLWQPPLYASGPSGLYAIGGAGVFDLVYLSGFLGLLGAWSAYRLLGRRLSAVGTPVAATTASPGRHLREAYRLAADGSTRASLDASAAAAQEAAERAQRLLGRSPADPARPWTGLPVPGWVVSDHVNLESVARTGTVDPRESWRGAVTARAVVDVAESIGRARFASIGQRLVAFAIDAALVGVVGGAIFAGIVVGTPGGLDGVVTSVAFNAAVYGFVGGALLYLTVAELWAGATIGKLLVGIEVRDRSLAPAGGLALFVRNAPLLPVMTLYSIGLALSIAIALDGIASSATLAGLGVSAGTVAIASLGLVVLAGIGLAGAVGVAAIAVSGERQRVGDLWAGTWVVRRIRVPKVPISVLGPAGPSA